MGYSSNKKTNIINTPNQLMIGAYTRISTENQIEGTSLQVQKERALEYASRENLPIKIFEDSAFSGTLSIQDRPALLDLITQIKEGLISHVYISNVDRLSRNFYNSIGLFSILDSHNIKLIIDGKETDLTDPNHNFQIHITAAFAEMERARIRQRVMSGMIKAVQNGKFVGTLPALGYTKDEKGFLIIDDEERKAIEKMFELYNRGMSCVLIARYLNENGYKTKKQLLKDKKDKLGVVRVNRANVNSIEKIETSETIFRPRTVHQILINPLYKGQQLYSGKYYPAPAIVTEEIWDIAAERLRSTKGGRTSQKSVIILQKKIKCFKCGRNYYYKNDKQSPYYTCVSAHFKGEKCGNKGILVKMIDGKVWEEITTLKKRLSKYVINYAKNNGTAETMKNMTILDDKKDEWDGVMKNARMKMLKDVITESEYLELKKEYDEFLEFYNQNLNHYKPELSLIHNQQDILNYLDYLHNQIMDADTNEKKKKVIGGIIDYILINNQEGSDLSIQIFYSINHLSQFKIESSITAPTTRHKTKTNFIINSIVGLTDLVTVK